MRRERTLKPFSSRHCLLHIWQYLRTKRGAQRPRASKARVCSAGQQEKHQKCISRGHRPAPSEFLEAFGLDAVADGLPTTDSAIGVQQAHSTKP